MDYNTLRTGLAWCLALSLLVLLPSCDQARPDLDVENKDQPNREKVLGTPQDVEGITRGMFADFFETYQHNWGGNYASLMETMADTYSCNWANFGMNRMSSEPRIQWNNDPAYSYAESNENPWFDGYTIVSNSADVLNAISNLGADKFAAEDVDVTRLKAFSNLMMGMVYGRHAAQYDRAFLVDETTDFEAVARGDKELKLRKYPKVLEFALQKLNKAEKFAKQGHSAIPPEWIYGLEISSQELVYLINSLKARYVAWTARTPQQRANLSYTDHTWQDIHSWIEAGIENTGYSGQWSAQTVSYSCRRINCPKAFDIPKERSKTTPAGFAPRSRGGFGSDGVDVLKWVSTQSNTWARADYRMIGAADVSNNDSDCSGKAGGDDGKVSCYPEYKNTLEANEWSNNMTPYVTETPDRRIQGPDGPKDHGKYMDYVGTALSAFPPSRGSYHYSDRTFVRYQYMPENQGPQPGEPMPLLTKPEMDLLKAEANLHMGNKSAAADLIDITRVNKGELPSASGAPKGDITQPPNPIGDYPTDQPTLWSMLQYEFRIETISTAGGLNFYTARGWGILPKGTPLHFPVPGKELNTLQRQVYTFGGSAGCAAPVSGTPGGGCFGGQGGSSSSSLTLDMEQTKTLRGVNSIRSVVNPPVLEGGQGTR